MGNIELGPNSVQGKIGQTDPRRQLLLAAYLATLVVAAVVGLTLTLAFHYTAASDASSVLGVVIPVFTAAIGLAVGGGAGVAAGTSAKLAAQRETKAANAKLAAAKKTTTELSQHFQSHASRLTTALPKPPQGRLYTMSLSNEDVAVADTGEVAEIQHKLGVLEGLLE